MTLQDNIKNNYYKFYNYEKVSISNFGSSSHNDSMYQ